jgi:hypothetical protein
VRTMLAAYLDQPLDSGLVEAWYQRLNVRRNQKESPLMRLSELQKTGRAPGLPLSIELADAAGPAHCNC